MKSVNTIRKGLPLLNVFPCIYPPRIRWLKKIVLKLLERNYMNIIFSSKKRTENMTDSMKIIQEHLRLAVLNVSYNLKYKVVHPIDPLIQWNSVWWSLRLNLDLSVSVLKTTWFEARLGLINSAKPSKYYWCIAMVANSNFSKSVINVFFKIRYILTTEWLRII